MPIELSSYQKPLVLKPLVLSAGKPTLILPGQKKPSVKMMLHKRLAKWEKARDHSHIHASDLMKELEFCPREWALLDLTKTKPKDQFIGTALAITFAHGKDLEYRVRNEWLRDVIVGYWRCGVCSYLHQTSAGNPVFGKAPKIKCPKCGWGHQWKYEEVRFTDLDSGISGGIDAIVDVGAPKHLLVEIKTLDKDQHKELKAPLAEHRFRTSLYLDLAVNSLLPEADKVNTKHAHILYVSKSFGFKDAAIADSDLKDSAFSPFKEFTVPRDTSLSATPIAKATALTQFRNNKSLGTPCGVCVNSLTKRAQKCSSVAACFSGKFPSTITWLENGKPRHPGKLLP